MCFYCVYIYVCMLKCEIGCKCIYKSFKNWVCINLGVEKCWVYLRFVVLI